MKLAPATRKTAIAAAIMATTLQASGALAGEWFVDPSTGSDVPQAGSEAQPWRTITYASVQLAARPPSEQAGAVINLRAGVLHPRGGLVPKMRGTPEQPIIIQPYGGPRAIIDASEESLRQPGAWTRVPGHPDEWQSGPLGITNGEAVWGQLMEPRHRLITYAKLEDLRASNQSFHPVPLSDPRDAFGPLDLDPTRKMPFTYLGPGVHVVAENPEGTVGRVHLRLAPTAMATPGIRDYPGGGDPNHLSVAVTRQGSVALVVKAAHVVLRNITFQNGADSTLSVDAGAEGVTFQRCEVLGGRHGVRVAGLLRAIRFEHCTFDGGLGPWTTRSDVKDDYAYQTNPPCVGGPCNNGMGRMTHAALVIHGADDSAFINCTFRRGHDALQVTGSRVEVDGSLFEDINDEAVQLNQSVVDVRIHRNMFRQVLHPLSFALAPRGGPVFFYRNVVDQRVPTRGYRVLPPDVPAPFVWRYGADVKDLPTMPFHAYQNTFISSHALDKTSFSSALFAGKPPVGFTYRNNIHILLNLDRELGLVQAPEAGVVTEGNVWHRAHHHPEPAFRAALFRSSAGLHRSLAELWAVHPHWERGSQVADPLLRDLGDEYFDHDGTPYPGADFRPAPGSPAIGRAVLLPPDLPDDFVSVGSPDVGARPWDADVMKVGVEGATSFPTPGQPSASAGVDRTIEDAGGDGFETVTLDASASRGSGNLTYRWLEAGRVVACTREPVTRLLLAEGRHHLQLVVTDGKQQQDSDDVLVTVSSPTAGANRLACAGFEERHCLWTLTPGARILATPLAHSGLRAVLLRAGKDEEVRQRVAVSPGQYVVSGWLARARIPSEQAWLEVRRLNGSGAVIETVGLTGRPGVGWFEYHHAVITVGAETAFLELAAVVHGALSGHAFVDDLRIRDRNLLQNGGFESPSTSGSAREVPGWTLERGGAIVGSPVHGGEQALALSPVYNGGNYNLATQTFAHASGRAYRFSARLSTAGVDKAPTFNVRLYDARGSGLGLHAISATTSEGGFSFVTADLPAPRIPAATATLKIELIFDGKAGTAWFDDVSVEPLPAP